MNLVDPGRHDGYPADYLLARVKGRRRSLITDYSVTPGREPPPVPSETALWRTFLTELRWLHRQMERRMRGIFAPVFLYFELRTLMLCLRARAAGEMEKVEEILPPSLLAPSLRRILLSDADEVRTVLLIADRFAEEQERFSRLPAEFERGGMRGFENALRGACLEEAACGRNHKVIRAFFASLIDGRNLLALYKHLRWGIETPPHFLKGGSISHQRLEKLLLRDETARIELLLGGSPDPGHGPDVELGALRTLSNRLRKEAGGDETVPVLLDYLWRSYIEVRNRGLLLFGRGVPPETLAGELVR